MDRPTCKTCPYWRELNVDPDDGNGECHRYPPKLPPTMALVEEVGPYGEGLSFPDAPFYLWCGEHPDFPDWIAHLRKQARLDWDWEHRETGEPPPDSLS
jgi:hypothetical protein